MIKEKSSSIFKKFKNIGCGCLLILIVFAIIGAIFGGIIIRKLISGAIQQKTGVQVNVDNINQGKLTYTDPKTGAKLNIGENKIPDDFPKDFPVYPGSSVTSSLSGNQNGQGNGFWLTLSTNDTADKVMAFYQENLKTNGWTTQTTTGAGIGTNWAVSKGTLTGYLTIDRPQNQNATSILIVLGANSSPTPVK